MYYFITIVAILCDSYMLNYISYTDNIFLLDRKAKKCL